jgi:hypothetical protein
VSMSSQSEALDRCAHAVLLGQNEGGGGSCVQTYYRLQVCRVYTHSRAMCHGKKSHEKRERRKTVFFNFYLHVTYV